MLFIIAALLTGVVLGLLFFGGLWYTVSKVLTSKRPALWFLGSYIFRMGIVLVGFYLILQRADLLDGVICLIGFIAARFMVLHLTKAYELKNSFGNKEVKEDTNET